MEIDRRMPKYIIREKEKSEKMRIRLERRVIGYEEKLEEAGGSE